jgi:hypothetical protein
MIFINLIKLNNINRRGFCRGDFVDRGFCRGDFVAGILSPGILSRGGFVARGFCRRGFCRARILSPGILSRGDFVTDSKIVHNLYRVNRGTLREYLFLITFFA